MQYNDCLCLIWLLPEKETNTFFGCLDVFGEGIDQLPYNNASRLTCQVCVLYS